MIMFDRTQFPIRFKILIVILLLVTGAVSTITFTMANLFHKDKAAYIRDLTSEMAMHTAAETRLLLTGYREKVGIFTELMLERDLYADQKSKLIGKLFEDFQEFVSVTLYEGDTELINVFDANSLEDAGLTEEVFFNHYRENPLPSDRILAGEVFVENSTLSERLPVFTLAFSHESPDSDQDLVVVSVIRLKGLFDLARRSRVFTSFVSDYNGNPLAHVDPQKVIRRDRVEWIPEVENLRRDRSYGTSLEFTENNVQMVGGLAHVEFGDLLAGVQIPKTAAFLTARDLLKNLAIISLILLILSALLSLFGARKLTRQIEQLSSATHAVGKGKFDIQVAVTSRDEIGELAVSFNRMASELDTREKALKEAQSALVQSEKMAAFGQLGAGIAHEVKNPLAGILGLSQISLRKADKETQLYKNLSIIEKETKRCKEIIENLLKFARQEKVSFERIGVNQVVEDATAIVDHQLGINKVTLEKRLGADLPQVMGNANQLEQVLMNLMINAQQAMEGDPGSVTVTTCCPDPEHVEIRISDTGPGIPEEIRSKIFEPFFTTKTVGKGTGLGLSVNYGIIKDHKGDIRVESGPEQGTEFIITLPVENEREESLAV